jgi:hypothetical protein
MVQDLALQDKHILRLYNRAINGLGALNLAIPNMVIGKRYAKMVNGGTMENRDQRVMPLAGRMIFQSVAPAAEMPH